MDLPRHGYSWMANRGVLLPSARIEARGFLIVTRAGHLLIFCDSLFEDPWIDVIDGILCLAEADFIRSINGGLSFLWLFY